MKTYYFDNITDFLIKNDNEILGSIQNNASYDTNVLQSKSWNAEIAILQKQLKRYNEGKIIFEYVIPRMGKRIDVVLLHKNIIFLLEFKCGETEYKKSAIDQVFDYALDLHNFHEESHDRLIVPIVVATEAEEIDNNINVSDNIAEPLKCNENNITNIINIITNKYTKQDFNYKSWINAQYYPTPTIVEAAQALYENHSVKEITRSDAGAENLSITTNKINEIIEKSNKNTQKSIIFVTGVPGAGKTLVGLNLAIQHSKTDEKAVFLSGNGPLVTVLQEALARDRLIQNDNKKKVLKTKKINVNDFNDNVNKELIGKNLDLNNIDQKIKEFISQYKDIDNDFLRSIINDIIYKKNDIFENKKDALRKTSSFIQNIHKYRDEFVNDNSKVPPERIAIFDEAQRAWTKEEIAKFMKSKKDISNFEMSEPEFLISTIDRHSDWGVIVCLVGGGQEINKGEAGLPEWFDSLRRSFQHWNVYITKELNDNEYLRGTNWKDMIGDLSSITEEKNLHLSTSVRSFRTPDLADFVKSVLDLDLKSAQDNLQKINGKYPIVLTRDLAEAKKWVKSKSQGSERYGLIASSGGLRLKAEGIFVKNNINVANWFLNGKDDVRSSYYLEDVATEFDIQGLEIDYSIVAWDADFRLVNNQWEYYDFSGSNWNHINKDVNKLYRKNAYRVLLTRARQGMVIYIPEGNDDDITRKTEYYDGIYNYLCNIGIEK